MRASLTETVKHHPAITGHVLFLLTAVAGLGVAWYLQIFGGLYPCPLCLEQRAPWYAGSIISVLALLAPFGLASLVAWRLWALLANMGLLLWGAYTAAYHIGVEHQWWGSSCTGPDARGGPMTIEELNAAMLGDTAVPCDAIQWEFLGITLAGYNLIISIGLFAVLAYLFLQAWHSSRVRSMI